MNDSRIDELTEAVSELRELFPDWRIGLFLLTAFVTAVAIASVGGIPYHGYPLVVMYGFAFLAIAETTVRVAGGRE